MLDHPANKKRPNPIDAHVGARIRLRRTMLGISQEKLGEALGITFQQVQKYEKGTNRVGASRLQAISTFLNAPVAYFFDAQAGSNVPAEVSGAADNIMSFISSAEGLALNRAFAGIADPHVRRKLVALARSIARAEDDPQIVDF